MALGTWCARATFAISAHLGACSAPGSAPSDTALFEGPNDLRFADLDVR